MDQTGPHRIAANIDALLPQTQCRQCGYDACRPYAEAIAAGQTEINRCPPGGARGIALLAALLGRAALPLDPACGVERPRMLAVVDEANCIGCTLCIQACPVDAIVGAAKQLHTVLSAQCTGCELCLPPCPVDCIELVPHPVPLVTPEFAALSRRRFERRAARLLRDQLSRLARLAAKAADRADPALEKKRRIVAAAVAKARSRSPGRPAG
jgi:electron transport complex protein RnfB